MTYLTTDELPTRADCFHDESTVLIGSPLLLTMAGNQVFNLHVRQNPPANGDSFSQSVFLKAGTYTFSVIGFTQNDCGMVDWYLDGAVVISGQDWYDAGTTYNVIKTATVLIASDGRHTIKGTVNGKNGASSDYRLNLTKFWFKQVSD